MDTVSLGMAFAAGLVWWEICLIGIIFVASASSLQYESALGLGLAVLGIILIPWGAGTAIASNLTFLGVLGYGAIYLVIGSLWSIFKWRKLVIDEIAYYADDVYDSWTTEKKKEKTLSSIANKKNYDTIGFWILAFPMSMIGYVVNDFIVALVKRIIDSLGGLFDKITNSLVNKNFS